MYLPRRLYPSAWLLHHLNLCCHGVVALATVLWLSGVLPPVDAFWFWLQEITVVTAFGGFWLQEITVVTAFGGFWVTRPPNISPPV